jgi:hypothetical protein
MRNQMPHIMPRKPLPKQNYIGYDDFVVDVNRHSSRRPARETYTL